MAFYPPSFPLHMQKWVLCLGALLKQSVTADPRGWLWICWAPCSHSLLSLWQASDSSQRHGGLAESKRYCTAFLALSQLLSFFTWLMQNKLFCNQDDKLQPTTKHLSPIPRPVLPALCPPGSNPSRRLLHRPALNWSYACLRWRSVTWQGWWHLHSPP